MRFFLFSLVTLLSAALPGPARAQERASGDVLRQYCGAWHDDGSLRLFSAEVRAPSLSYGDGALQAELSRAFVVDDGPRGVVEVFPGETMQAAALVPIQEGARLVKAQAAGKLQARLGFYAERSSLTATPCLLISGGRMTRIRIVPLWVALVQGGREQARLYTEIGETMAPTGHPEVQIDPKELVFDGDPQDLPAISAALGPVQKKALGCYQRALSQKPGLTGKIVFGIDVDRDGRGTEPRVEVDALGDSGLARCLRGEVAALRLGRPRRAGHLSLPLWVGTILADSAR